MGRLIGEYHVIDMGTYCTAMHSMKHSQEADKGHNPQIYMSKNLKYTVHFPTQNFEALFYSNVSALITQDFRYEN